MTKTIIIAIVLAAELFTSQITQAQGTLYVSSLGQAPNTSEAIGSDSWLAQPFRTGTNSGGYMLNSVQLLMNAASGIPNGFSVSIYSSLNPMDSLDDLSGSDPSSGGVFTYTTSGILLSPYTRYFIVITAATPVAQGAYSWSATDLSEINVANKWAIAGQETSSNGSDWNFSRAYIFQMAIYATPIPEPATGALFGIGLACLSFWRLRQLK